MRLRTNLLIIAAAATALFAGATLPACTREYPPALPGNPAPPFSLKGLDGKAVRLADYAGKVVVLDFWATWCGPCKEAMPEFETVHRAYRERGVVVLGISVNKESDAAALVAEFARRHGLTYPLVIDDASAYKAYGVARIPATYILDRRHVIRETYPGYQPGLGKRIAADVSSLL